MRDILKAQAERRGREDEFRHQLDSSRDKFQTYAEYMSLGILGYSKM